MARITHELQGREAGEITDLGQEVQLSADYKLQGSSVHNLHSLSTAWYVSLGSLVPQNGK